MESSHKDSTNTSSKPPRIPNAFAKSAEVGLDAAAERNHAVLVQTRHQQESVAKREQNREGPPPYDLKVNMHAVGAPRSSTSAAASVGGAEAPAKPAKKTISVAKSKTELKHWFRTTRKRHMKKMTPAQKQRMKRNVALQNMEQRKHRLGRKAKKMAYASASARSNVMSSIATYSPVLNVAQSKAEEQAVRQSANAAMESLSAIQSARLSESESEEDIAHLEDEAEAATAAVTEEKAKALLDELKVEPKDEEETADKFKIYEQYLEVVSKSRQECFKFHKACVSGLQEHRNVIAKMAKAIKSIDSDANSSINWEILGKRWFVYDMTVQSDRNNGFIGRIFKGLKRDLEMIQNNDMDCPICLENLMTIPTGIKVLRCCHKLCGECYENWRMACHGGRVVCPLCRQQDFQAAVVTRSPAIVQQYLHDMASESEDSDGDLL